MATESFVNTIAGGAAASKNGCCSSPARALRRQISPANGRALEMLGHAIEYLTDEYALRAIQTGTLEAGAPRLEAIQMLMALNRQIYYACPVKESSFRRIARWLL